jgi:hypothetical protein
MTQAPPDARKTARLTGRPMDGMADDQRTARIFGWLFIITFLTSIPAALLYGPVLNDPAGYIAGGGKDTQIYFAAFLEFCLVISNVGKGVVL